MAEKEEGAASDEYSTLVDATSDLGKRIRGSLDFLCKNSTNLPEVIVNLFSRDLLEQRESEVIEKQLSSFDCFRQLFTFIIPRLGHENNSLHFFNAFQQSGNDHILKQLKSAAVATDFTQRTGDTSSPKVRFNVQEQVASFVGRKDFLRDLHEQILKSQRMTADDSTNSTITSRICVVTGLGGIGKSQTIRKYIHSYGQCYQHVVWIDAEDHNTAENQFRRLALQKLDLSSKDKENNANDFDFIIDEIYDRLCTSHTLIVLDNAEALDEDDSQRTALRQFLPKRLPHTHLEPVIIITSRQLEWPDLQPTPLPLFTPQESSTFIFRQLKLEESDANRKDVGTLSETFDGLPLALQAAVAVIFQECKRNKLRGQDVYTIQHLLSDYDQEKRKVLEKRPPGSPDIQPLMFLWKVSLDKIRQQPQGHLASHMLDVMAHLLSTNIPKDFLFFIFNHEDSDIVVDAVTLLVDYSFVHDYQKQFSVHRILQDVTLAHLKAHKDKNPDKQELLLATPLIRVTRALMIYWPRSEEFSEAFDAVHANLIHVTMSHVLPKLQNPADTDVHLIPFTVFVLGKIEYTRPVEAEKCCRLLIACFTRPATPSSSGSLLKTPYFKLSLVLRRQLAWILKDMGRYMEAEDICQELMSSINSLKDKEDVRVEEILATKHTLGTILYRKGEYEKAIKLFYSVIDLSSNIPGPIYESTMNTKNNLALALQKVGRLSEARTLHAEILEVKTKDLGPLHPNTLNTKHNMAMTLLDEGRYDDALEMLREVADMQQRELGPLQAETLNSNTNIAYVLNKLGKHEDALEIYESITSSYEKVSTASDPRFLRVKHGMAVMLGKLGRFDEAKEMLRQVLDNQERLLRPNHVDTLITKDSMAELLVEQGKHTEALKLYEEVLELKTKQLGPVHPSTLQTNNSIGWLHLKMENFEKAASIGKEVLATRKATLSSNHPDLKDTETLCNKACLRNGC